MRRSDSGARSAEPDATKRCPYCAEVIQAAAIRCRYCHSDLTEPAPAATPAAAAAAAEPGTVVEAGPAPEAVTEQESGPQPEGAEGHAPAPVARTWSPRTRAAIIGAAVVALVLLVTAVVLWRQAAGIEDARQAGRTARAAVSEKVELLLTYDYKTFDKDAEAAEKVLTPSFQEEYAPTRETIRDRAIEQRRSQQATVAAVSVISQDADRVETLLFVDTVSTREGSRRQRVLQNRVKVTMVRDDDTWLIDDLTVPQS